MIVGVKSRKISVLVKAKSELAITENSTLKDWEGKVQTIHVEDDWRKDIIDYLQHGILPTDQIEAKQLLKRSLRFVVLDGELYKRTFEGPLLRCLNKSQAEYVMREIHEGSCGNHSGGRALAQKVVRQGYFWPTLRKDTTQFTRCCKQCQLHGNLLHQPGAEMKAIAVTYPFDQWGIDIVGPFPPAKGQRKFVIVAVEYFSKWIEAEATAKISEGEVISFIWKNIVCRFGVPRIIISDNGTQFQGKKIKEWCKEMKIQQNFTSVGNPQANGQTEVTNRIMLQHLKARLEGSKGHWAEELPGVLWAYRTTPRSSTGETPFCLVYGSEAVIPAEIGLMTQRVNFYEPLENASGRRLDLELIEEKRDKALAQSLIAKKKMMRKYNKKVKQRDFQVGDLVLKKVEVSKHVGKLDPNWEGPFLITKVSKNGSYRLQTLEGKNLPRPWGIQNLKKFYT